MGEELELNRLYMKVGDGGYIPFDGIQPADIVCVDEMDEELYNSLPQSGTINFNFTISHKERREWIKQIRKDIGRTNRIFRMHKRHKENFRRKALKEGFKMIPYISKKPDPKYITDI